MTTPPTAAFFEACSGFGIELEPNEAPRLGRFVSLLMEANARTNLTAIRDVEEVWIRHIFDALTLLPVLGSCGPGEPGRALRVCDVGSGGGVPGLPLAIVRSDIEFTLLEATGRKVAFLEHVVAEMGLANVRVVQGRAERVGAYETPEGEPALRDRFDCVTARALGRIAVASELCVPLSRVGGVVALVKGQRADEELIEAKQAMHMLHVAHSGTVDTPTGRIVVFEKLRPTPRRYPRRDGEPKRSPLGVSQGPAG
ncbi:MAG TPA: 16S rRNA (guanine(527)-N(7))-methyltransferase RsmG [Phycisphaerales bacterium]|nr:16S rRNA (guanine(527)-N(7))-methyltransferase RsmG [Phycisphaerales bacterium]